VVIHNGLPSTENHCRRACAKSAGFSATGPLLYTLEYLLPSRQRRFDLDQAAIGGPAAERRIGRRRKLGACFSLS
jgi:hypothetical protein